MAAAQRENGVPAETVVAVRGLVSRFGDNVIHDGLSLTVRRGEVLGVVGASGSGKSVLLRTIVGLLRPAAGAVEVLGRNLLAGGDDQRNAIERRLGVLFQDGALFSSLTVAENIQVPLREHLKLSPRLMDEIAALKIALAGLDPSVGPRYPAELSGGMRKRAGLARALALDPEIVFLDEPTAGLDPIAAAAFDELVRNLNRALGLTVFMVTHDLDSLFAVCDRIAALGEGRVLVEGTPESVIAHPHPWIRDYFGGPRGRAAAAVRH